MVKVNLVLAGYGNFGRIIAQKMKKMEKEGHITLPENLSVRFYAIAEPREERQKEAGGLGVKVVRDVKELAREISRLDGKVVAWIATPSSEHVEHLKRLSGLNKELAPKEIDMMNIVEKPLSLDEKALKDVKKVKTNWAIDLIEEQNPSILSLIDYLKDKGLKVKGGELEFYRMNSIGIRKLLDPEFRVGIEGGADLDKMIHDVGLAFFLARELGGNVKNYRVTGAKVHHYMPADLEGTALLDRWMRRTKKVNKKTAIADGELEAVIKTMSGKFKVKVRGGWIGVPPELKRTIVSLAKRLGKNPLWVNENKVREYSFPWEELRLFRVKLKTDEGEKEFLGNMLPRGDGFFLFVKDKGKWREIPIRTYPGDQLERILANAISVTLGRSRPLIEKSDAVASMKTLFKARKKAEGSRKIKSLLFLIRNVPRARSMIRSFRERIRLGKAVKEANRTVGYIKRKIMTRKQRKVK